MTAAVRFPRSAHILKAQGCAGPRQRHPHPVHPGLAWCPPQSAWVNGVTGALVADARRGQSCTGATGAVGQCPERAGSPACTRRACRPRPPAAAALAICAGGGGAGGDVPSGPWEQQRLGLERGRAGRRGRRNRVPVSLDFLLKPLKVRALALQGTAPAAAESPPLSVSPWYGWGSRVPC